MDQYISLARGRQLTSFLGNFYRIYTRYAVKSGIRYSDPEKSCLGGQSQDPVLFVRYRLVLLHDQGSIRGVSAPFSPGSIHIRPPPKTDAQDPALSLSGENGNQFLLSLANTS
jgi:hypothetical protein